MFEPISSFANFSNSPRQFLRRIAPRRFCALGGRSSAHGWTVSVPARSALRSRPAYISYRSAGASLKTHRVPVNLDIPQPEVLVDEDDPHVNLLGVNRLGEIDQMAQSIGNYEPPPR